MTRIAVGDRVCYSKKFLQSTGQYTGNIPKARRGGSGAWRAQGQAWRDRTAARLRELRQGGLQRQAVRSWFNQNVRNKQGGGTAVRCDLEELLIR